MAENLYKEGEGYTHYRKLVRKARLRKRVGVRPKARLLYHQKQKGKAKFKECKLKKLLRYYRKLYGYIKRYLRFGFLVDLYVSKSNIFTSVSRRVGGSLFCFTQGMIWDKYLKKGSTTAAERVGYIFGRKVFAKCYYPLILRIYSRINLVVEAAVEGYDAAGLFFRYLILVPIIRHNGCKTGVLKRKKRRQRRRRD